VFLIEARGEYVSLSPIQKHTYQAAEMLLSLKDGQRRECLKPVDPGQLMAGEIMLTLIRSVLEAKVEQDCSFFCLQLHVQLNR
jgi:hypothetical protein